MQRLIRYLRYDNTVPLILGVLFLGSTSAFAATNPEAIYSVDEKIISIDNSYLVQKDLGSFTPQARILSVTEDDESYFVTYAFSTISLSDGAWKDTSQEIIQKVSKADLGPYRDLGLYVMAELRQKIDSEVAYLKQVQEIERKQVSSKVVAVEYGGLVGHLFTDTVETIPGYQPIVTPPMPDAQVAGSAGASVAVTPQQTGPAQLQILGNNPAAVPLFSSYVDLGAVVFDGTRRDIDISLSLDGVNVSSIQIETRATSTRIIKYTAVVGGQTVSAERKVIVYDPAFPPDLSGQVYGSLPPSPTPVVEEVTPPPLPPDEGASASSTPVEVSAPEVEAPSTPPVVAPSTDEVVEEPAAPNSEATAEEISNQTQATTSEPELP
ncbi:MAG: hypothetical protein RIQ56_458 [Candidatus Parcubacteria bacterium]|jgi:hypothetical protein